MFNMLVAIRKNGWKGVRVKREKICSLAYADIVLLAEEEEGMKCMMKGLKRYLREKDLELNVGKSKVRFRKGERRRRIVEWW